MTPVHIYKIYRLFHSKHETRRPVKKNPQKVFFLKQADKKR